MHISQALQTLGVHPGLLSATEKNALDNDGFVILRGILTPAQVDAINIRSDQLLAAEGENAGLEVHQEKGTDRLANLLDKGSEFHVTITIPRVLSAIAHVLNYDMKFSACNTRAALPGQGTQALHSDWPDGYPVRTDPNRFYVCNSLWLLDDFTLHNGPTRVVPGTHRSLKTPQQELGDPNNPHPDEIRILGKAGDVVVINSHTWHGGTRNTTSKTRRLLSGYYCNRHLTPLTDQRKSIRPDVANQLPKHLRVLLDID